MAKKEYRILVLLLLIIAGHLDAQQFNFEGDKKQSYPYNRKIAELLDKDDAKGIKRLLEKESSLVNSSSRMTNVSNHAVLSGGKVPLLYDAVDRYLNNKCSFEILEVLLNYSPNMYSPHEGLTPFYLVMNYISTNKISVCERANKIFILFANQPGFDVNQKYEDLPPPLSYLLSTNTAFLNNSYSREYISTEVILTLLNKGASLNARDANGVSLFSFAIITENAKIIDYCIKNNVHLSLKDKYSKDALFYAIRSNNFENVVLIINNKYPLSENCLAEMNVFAVLHAANEDINNFIFDKLKYGVKTLENTINLVKLFPEKKMYFITEGYHRNNLNISLMEIPALLDLLIDVSTESPSAIKNIKDLINEYKIFIITNANQSGCLDCLIKIKLKYGLNTVDYSSINERKYLETTIDINAYREIFPNEESVFANRCKTNDYFDGEIKNGYANGIGIALNEKGLFKGAFVNGIPDGIVNIAYSNGDTYIGNMTDGSYNEHGILSTSKGSYKYTGNFRNGLFDGEGSDGYYEGSWKAGRKHGFGQIHYKRYYSSYTDDVYYENGSLIHNYSEEARTAEAERNRRDDDSNSSSQENEDAPLVEKACVSKFEKSAYWSKLEFKFSGYSINPTSAEYCYDFSCKNWLLDEGYLVYIPSDYEAKGFWDSNHKKGWYYFQKNIIFFDDVVGPYETVDAAKKGLCGCD